MVEGPLEKLAKKADAAIAAFNGETPAKANVPDKAPGEKIDGDKAAEKADAAKKAKEARVKKLSGMKLADLKSQFGEAKDAEALGELVKPVQDLKDKSFQFSCDGIDKLQIDDVKNAVDQLLPADLKFEKIAVLLGIEEQEVRTVMAYVLANSLKATLEQKLKETPKAGKLEVGVVFGSDGLVALNLDPTVAAPVEGEPEKPKTGDDLLNDIAGLSVDGLKERLNDEAVMNQVLSLSNLDGLRVEGNLALISGGMGSLEPIRKAVLGRLVDENMPKVAEILKMKEVAVAKIKDTLATMYANQLFYDVKEKYKAYPRMADFLKTEEGKKFKSMKVSAVFSALSASTITFDDTEIKPLYDEFVKKNPDALDDADIQAKAKAIAASPLGGLLGTFLGYGKVAEGETMTGFEKLAAGMDPIGGFILGLFGYKGFEAACDGVIDMCPPKLQASLNKAKAKARISKFKPKDGVEKGKEGDGVAQHELFGKEQFVKFVNGKDGVKMPEKGIQLKEDLDLAKAGFKAGELRVDFSKGGEMIVPPVKDSQLRVNGAPQEPDTLKTGNRVLTGVIPAGVVFTGNVGFLDLAKG